MFSNCRGLIPKIKKYLQEDIPNLTNVSFYWEYDNLIMISRSDYSMYEYLAPNNPSLLEDSFNDLSESDKHELLEKLNLSIINYVYDKFTTKNKKLNAVENIAMSNLYVSIKTLNLTCKDYSKASFKHVFSFNKRK